MACFTILIHATICHSPYLHHHHHPIHHLPKNCESVPLKTPISYKVKDYCKYIIVKEKIISLSLEEKRNIIKYINC